jgi:hypothetical protein
MKIQFEALIQKFGDMGEKTGWRYFIIPASLALKLKPDNRKAFRVKGFLDAVPVKEFAVMPMGDGEFIFALKADLRKKLRKQEGATIKVDLELDTDPFILNSDLMDCLSDVPEALQYLNSLTPSHQRYFSNWVTDAKTMETKEKRILICLRALEMKWDYGQMIRDSKKILS